MTINKVVSFRVTDEEYKKIGKAAKKSIRTISNWLRKEVLEKLRKENVNE